MKSFCHHRSLFTLRLKWEMDVPPYISWAGPGAGGNPFFIFSRSKALNVKMSRLGKMMGFHQDLWFMLEHLVIIRSDTSKWISGGNVFWRNDMFNNNCRKESEEISFVRCFSDARRPAWKRLKLRRFAPGCLFPTVLLIPLHVPLSLPSRPPSPARDTKRSECFKTLLVDAAACHMQFQ